MWSLVTDVVAKASYTDWVVLAVSFCLLFYIWGTWNYDFFTKRGVPCLKPKLPFVGNNLLALFGLTSSADLLKDLHAKAEGHGICGIFQLTTPLYMVCDPELLKIITVKYADQFMNHKGFTAEDSDNIFNKNLFAMKGQRWRNVRSVLSPGFTTSKIKAMFPLMSRCGEQMVEHLREKYNSIQGGSECKPLELDMKNLFCRFANDVIATAAFGVQCDSLKEPENEFFKMGKLLTTFTPWRTFVFFVNFILPKLAKFVSHDVVDPKAVKFFEDIIYQTMKEREEKGIFRPDVLQLMMQARKGELKVEAGDEHEAEKIREEKTSISDRDIAAQIIIFFFAGFESVSTGICFTAYALSINQDVQTRLQQEIDEAIEEAGGQYSYDVIQNIKYLDMVVQESLRLFPPIIGTDRICSENVLLPAIGKTPPMYIKKGDYMSIPTVAIHHDPKHWPDPLTFNPERFSEENKHNITPFTYLPFGLGPRICIAQRFAILEIKIAIAHLVKNFNLLQSKKIKLPMQFEKGVNNTIKGGFWCDLVKREIE